MTLPPGRRHHIEGVQKHRPAAVGVSELVAVCQCHRLALLHGDDGQHILSLQERLRRSLKPESGSKLLQQFTVTRLEDSRRHAGHCGARWGASADRVRSAPMPEGHTLHRHAREQRRDLAGRVLTVTSPQGRFADGAAHLDGRRLEQVEAVGKHLFYRWEGGPILHVHLGLFGKFATHHGGPPQPTERTRLAMAADGITVYLAGPNHCSVIDPAEEDAIRSRLGPDPLRVGRRGADGFRQNLTRRTIPIGAALLDQKVVAGIGNVYRAEVLFLSRIHPATPARELDPGTAGTLYQTLTDQLRLGLRMGKIVTVDPAELGARTRRSLHRDERLYVYHRDGLPCRRCGTEIHTWEMANRSIWACPFCQPLP